MLEMANSLPYAIEVRTVSTPGSRSFAIQDDTCSGAELPPGATCRLSMVFAPTVVGAARSPIDVGLRHLCTATDYFPCNWTEPEIQTGTPNFTRVELPSGQVAFDWTTSLRNGRPLLVVEGFGTA